MLKGAEEFINQDKIGYLFISTYSNEIHQECLEFLVNKDYLILTDIAPDETFSIDGLIVARSKKYSMITNISGSKK